MNRKIPIPLAATVADVLALRYTHNRIDQFMDLAGIPGQLSPGLNKVDKTRAWLNLANQHCPDPLGALGIALTELMEVDTVGYASPADLSEEREKIQRALAAYGLTYVKGGMIMLAGATAVSKGIEEIIEHRDLAGLQTEFDRIFRNIESDPAAAVTASCALLESLFKVFITEEGLDMPSDKTIKPLWNIVRKNLNLEPSKEQADDIRTVLVGLGAIVDGLGSLRTHEGSAHGHEKRGYAMKPRHARLTSHAAFTLAMFILETWPQKTQPSKVTALRKPMITA